MSTITTKDKLVYGFLVVIFLIHQLLQKGLGLNIPIVHAYLDDLLVMPLILGLFQWERNRLWGLPKLQTWEIIAMTCFVCCLFEIILPSFSKTYTRDWLDGICYTIGSISFWLWERKKHEQPTKIT